MSARRRRLEDGIPLALALAIIRDARARPHTQVDTLARIHGVTWAVVLWAIRALPRRRL
jgi:hypothetical protein